MEYWFSLVLKAIATVLIVYAMMIPLFKHHNVLNLFDGLFVLILIILLLSFESTIHYFIFGIVMGSIGLLYGCLKFFVLNRTDESYFIFHVTFKDKANIESCLEELLENATIEPDMIQLDSKYPFVFRMKIQDKTVKKNFLKAFDQMIRIRFNYAFLLRYGIFLVIFIILAIIWRY